MTKVNPRAVSGPTQHYAYMVVYNKDTERRYVHKGLTLGEVEAVWQDRTWKQKAKAVVQQVGRDLESAGRIMKRADSTSAVVAATPGPTEPPSPSEVTVDSGQVSEVEVELSPE